MKKMKGIKKLPLYSNTRKSSTRNIRRKAGVRGTPAPAFCKTMDRLEDNKYFTKRRRYIRPRP
jgi:hypothetical protein